MDNIKKEEEFHEYTDKSPIIEFVGAPGEFEKSEREKRKVVIASNKGKIVSLVIAISYLLFGLIGGGQTLLMVIAFLILPLALIWLPDYFSYSLTSSVNPISGFTGVTKEPVGKTIIKFIGWVVLLGPIMRVLAMLLISK